MSILYKEASSPHAVPPELWVLPCHLTTTVVTAHPGIWAKTSMSKGGAKDHAAGPIAKAASIMAERMELKGDERAALLSSEGFKAYADEMIWVSACT